MKKHLGKTIVSLMVILILTLVLILPSTGVLARGNTEPAATEVAETTVQASSANQRRERALKTDSRIPPRFENEEEFKNELGKRGLSDEQITEHLRLRDEKQEQRGIRLCLRDQRCDNCDPENCPYGGNPPADKSPGRNKNQTNQTSEDNTAPVRGRRGRNAHNSDNTPGRGNRRNMRDDCPLGQN
ncbi:MAG: hypothetical protein ACOYEL_05685 [Saccharofermentanales bacterium]